MSKLSSRVGLFGGPGTITSSLKHVAPAALLAALFCAPPATLEQYPSSGFAFRLFLGLWTMTSLNRVLNIWATNNWHASAHDGWEWKNEVAVVTGGSGGIGEALVQGLTAKNIRVAVLDLRELPETLKPNDKVSFFKCDVSSLSSVTEARDAIYRKFDRHPSILINNAGIVRTTTILDEPEDHLRKIVGVNLMAHWFTAKTFLPPMLAQNKGHVVTVASLASYVALPTSVDYSATKAGALAFHEGLTCEIKHLYKAPGVMTTIVHPEFVDTQMTRHYLEDVKKAGGVILTAKQATDPVLEQIFSRRGGHLIVPWSRTIVSTLRGWPNWMQELLRDVIGRADR